MTNLCTFEIKENIEINLETIIDDGEIGFVPTGLDTANDWASYSLETTDGDTVAEHVSFEALEVHSEHLLIEWYKTTYPEDYAFSCAEGDNIAEAAEEKLQEVLDSPDELYNAHLTSAKRTALADWLKAEEPKIYRDDLRDFGNEFDLTFVLAGAEYEPGDGEYELSADDAVKYFFMYTDDPTAEDFSSATVIE